MKQFERTALLANNLSERDTSRGVKAKIVFTQVNVPVDMSQIDGVGDNTTETTADKISYRLTLKSVFTAKRSDEDVKVALVDKDDTDDEKRFVYIGHAYSILYNVYEVFWYDSKYKDIIKIPELTTAVDIENGRDINKYVITNGEIVALDVDTSRVFKSTKFSLEDIGNGTIEGVKDIPGIASHVLRIDNFRNRSKTNNTGLVMSEDVYLEGLFTEAVEAYSLGGAEELITNEDSRITNIKLYRRLPDAWVLEQNRKKNIDDILILK
jgi:hypothetical protein